MTRISIDHLGPIHQVEMDMKQMNILIGEQATGKSMLCKAIFFFRNFKQILLDYYYSVEKADNQESPTKALRHRLENSFVDLFGYSWQLPDKLSVAYHYTDEVIIDIKVRKSKGNGSISVTFSSKLASILENMYMDVKKHFDSMSDFSEDQTFFEVEKKYFYKRLNRKISALLDDDMNTYYIPAGRELLSLLCNQKTYLNYVGLDPLNRKFMQTIESLQPNFINGTSGVSRLYSGFETRFDAKKVSESIIRGIKGEYFCQGNKEYLQMEDGQKILINFASSGQQEVLWLYNQLFVMMLRGEKSFVFIEEPEAHLYPALQKNLLDFIVTFLNVTGSTVVVTTHSPYMLTEANNLYIAGKLKEDKNKSQELEQIAGEWHYIPYGDLNAYKMNYQDGETKLESLLDTETQEILAVKIDEISAQINEVYSQLFYLEEA